MYNAHLILLEKVAVYTYNFLTLCSGCSEAEVSLKFTNIMVSVSEMTHYSKTFKTTTMQ